MAPQKHSSTAASEEAIPTYVIDLSLPPQERYRQLAKDLGPRMRALKPLLDEVLMPVLPHSGARRAVKMLAWLVLRRVYSPEETLELRGIADASGLDMYFLVAMNVLLDSFLGCTSGGVMTRQRRRRRAGSEAVKAAAAGERMLHFRTLDWGMDSLRDVIVVLEFVRSKSADPEKVIARSITYAGLVGCLTGVRERLSVSLNFRPYHICSTAALRLHQTLVLVGLRPSIVSVIRGAILPEMSKDPPTLGDLRAALARPKAAPCYLILCDGKETVVIERDLTTAKTRSSKNFIVQTNHDTAGARPLTGRPLPPKCLEKNEMLGMKEFLDDSGERQECLEQKWKDIVSIQREKAAEKNGASSSRRKLPVVSEETLQRWVRASPTMNECTHFACILDPTSGTIPWIARGAGE